MTDNTLAPPDVDEPMADGPDPTEDPPGLDHPPNASDIVHAPSSIGDRPSDIVHPQDAVPRRVTYRSPYGVGFSIEAHVPDPHTWAEAQCRANNLPFDPSLVLMDEAGEPHTSSVDPS